MNSRTVTIAYVYADPALAWEYTLAREQAEGRNIPRETFIEQFITAKINVNMLKEEFGGEISVWLIKNRFESGKPDIKFNINRVDDFVDFDYTAENLESLI